MNIWNLIGRIDNVVGIVSGVVAVITLVRVSSIARARREERLLLARALRLRELGNSLNQNASLLAGPTLERRILDDTRADLMLLSSELQAALRILVPDDDMGQVLDGVQLVADGYWTDTFASRVLLNAKRRISVVTWRNSRILSVGIMQQLLRQMTDQPGLVVDIYALSAQSSSEVCENLSRMLSLASADTICAEQAHHRDVASNVISRQLEAGTIPANTVARLHYHEYGIMPFLHCVVVDDDVYWGINFYMDASSGAGDSLSRAFVHAPARSEFGRKIIEQVDIVRSLSTEVPLASRNPV